MEHAQQPGRERGRFSAHLEGPGAHHQPIEQEQQEGDRSSRRGSGDPLRSPGEEVGPHEDAGKDQIEPEDLEPAHKGAGGDRPVPQGIGVFQEPLWEQRPAEAGRRQRQGHACPRTKLPPGAGRWAGVIQRRITFTAPSLLSDGSAGAPYPPEGEGKGQLLPSDGLPEGQLGGVEGRAGDQGTVLVPVKEISCQGAAQRGHVDPDLVGAPGVQLQTDQGTPPGAGQGLIPCAGVPCRRGGPSAPPGSPPGAPAGRLPHRRGLRPAVAHRQIDTAEGWGVELPLQHLPGRGGAWPLPSARRSPVQPVDGVEISFNTLRIVIIQQKLPIVSLKCPGPGWTGTPGALFRISRSPSSYTISRGPGRAGCRCAAPGRTGGRTESVPPGGGRRYSPGPRPPGMPSGSHLIRRITVPDRCSLPPQQGVHLDAPILRPQDQLQAAGLPLYLFHPATPHIRLDSRARKTARAEK